MSWGGGGGWLSLQGGGAWISIVIVVNVHRDLKLQLEALKQQTPTPSSQHTSTSLYEVYTRTETEKFANLSKVGAVAH